MLVKLLVIGGLFSVLISLGVALMRLIRGGGALGWDGTRAHAAGGIIDRAFRALDDRVRHRMADPERYFRLTTLRRSGRRIRSLVPPNGN